MIPGSPIGKAFVAKLTGEIIGGEGVYCGFPIVLRLKPGEEDGRRGYDVVIHIGLPGDHQQ
jgi:hypothetical protein